MQLLGKKVKAMYPSGA